jgi:hypothetical protein
MIKYEKASDLNAKMKNVRSKDRPSCKEILDIKHIWSLSEIEFDFENELESITKNSDPEIESYLISVIKNRHQLERDAKIITNFMMISNEKRDLIRNLFLNIEFLHFFSTLKPTTHVKEKNLTNVFRDVYNSPIIIKILTFLFVVASLADYFYSSGAYFAHIFAILIALPIIVSAFYFDILIACFLIFSNQTISTFIFERRFKTTFIIFALLVYAFLVTLIFAAFILKLFLPIAFIAVVIIILAIIFDSLFFDRSNFNALVIVFGEYVLCFSILSIGIFFILIFSSHYLGNSILYYCLTDSFTADISKFAFFICIFYVLNLWFFVFFELIFNSPILNCRKSTNFIRREYFIHVIRFTILFFIVIFTASALILDFFFAYAFVISIVIIWSIYSDALISHRDFFEEFAISFKRYVLSFCAFSYINYSILFFYAIIFENPIIDRSFAFAFNPNFSLFEYSFLILFIIICWILKLVDHSFDNLILNRRINFSLSQFVLSSGLFLITFFCVMNSIIPIFDKSSLLNQRIISILIFCVYKFILLFCTFHIFLYIVIVSVAVFLNRFQTLNYQFFSVLFYSFTKFLVFFCVSFYIIPKLPILNRSILVNFNTITFVSIILSLKHHYEKFTFGFLIKPASFFGIIIISLLIFGTNNFISFLSNYNFLIIYCSFIIAN